MILLTQGGEIYTEMDNYLKENKENKSKILGEIIKERREYFNFSQREIARKLKIDNSGLAKIERGERKKPSVIILKKLSLLLKIDLTFLMKKAGYDESEIELATSQTIIYDVKENQLIDEMIENRKKELSKLIKEKEILEKISNKDIVFNVIDETGQTQIEINRFIEDLKKERTELIDKKTKSIKKLEELLNKHVVNKDK